jgi:hypothetical protein
VAATLLLGPAAAHAAELDIPVPYVPSTAVAVDEMLRLASITPQDVVVDLGSGDGRIVIAAAKKFGARGFGVDIDADLVREANDNARKQGVAERVQFFQRDIFATDISQASVVTLYLLTGMLERLKPKLLNELKPGARVVAHEFAIPGWRPDLHVNISKDIYLWVVPAQVAGKWELAAQLPGGPRRYEFELAQQNQVIRGGARVPGGYLPLFDARIDGDRISFVVVEGDVPHHFDGRVAGGSMQGQVKSGVGREAVESNWRAVKASGGAS